MNASDTYITSTANVKISAIYSNFFVWFPVVMLINRVAFKSRGSVTQHFDHYFASASPFYDCIKNPVDTVNAQSQPEIAYLSLLYGSDARILTCL